MKTALAMIFPHRCAGCGAVTETEGLCAPCWADVPFIAGLSCDRCGAPLPGDAAEAPALCDQCLDAPPPWARGRAAARYDGTARKLVLALKHGDRTELAPLLGAWLRQAGDELLDGDTILVPVPLHWTRRLRRGFNQAALLAREVARRSGASVAWEGLVRVRRTPPQGRRSREERAGNVAGAFRADPRWAPVLAGRRVVLVDDVLASGSTMAAAARALSSVGPEEISVLALARVADAP